MKIKPIEEWSDLKLIRMVKLNGDNDAFLEICRRTEKLFFGVCHKYSSALASKGVFLQDIFNEKNYIILSCIKSFNPKRGTKLSSHIGNYARFLCLNSMNARRFIIPQYGDDNIQKKIEDQQVYQNYSHQMPHLEESRDYIFSLLNKADDKRIRDVFKYRYSGQKKMIWNKIAKKMKTSPQTIMNLHSRGLALIKEKLSKEEDLLHYV